ncbi:MAG: SCPU domain-containing protein [Betaproteobacteria bacterium]|nr:SCPU domain-containing protein [Betaproteobacteria bacterium]
MQTRRLSLAIAIAAALTSQAWADSKSSSFQVGVQVVATCSIAAADMTFNTMTTGTTGVSDAASDITVNCSENAPYAIALSNGGSYSGGRRLTDGTKFINYFLYKDPTRAQSWDAANTLSFVGSGAAQSHTVYGRIPSGQSVPNMGRYTDTVVATVSY